MTKADLEKTIKKQETELARLRKLEDKIMSGIQLVREDVCSDADEHIIKFLEHVGIKATKTITLRAVIPVFMNSDNYDLQDGESDVIESEEI